MDLNIIYHFPETEITLITIIWIHLLLRFTINLKDCIFVSVSSMKSLNVDLCSLKENA